MLTATAKHLSGNARRKPGSGGLTRTISGFLAERKSALDFIVHDNMIEDLMDPLRLAVILENLQKSFGGVTDIGVIDAHGRQVVYMGPYLLEGKNYSGQKWFQKVVEKGIFVSDVFLADLPLRIPLKLI